ncbi:hypothetical protein JIR001_08460 [Polycladomyces abyssicola]|uniref:Uncharacterized protein n=1 Tax=Polycladomyces abyssicola TaxID=1125966 RepID=A0A8D5ZN75_9BACL|nr:hypothetical protein JIR001_08460 [Polycladomyces abyssicola]
MSPADGEGISWYPVNSHSVLSQKGAKTEYTITDRIGNAKLPLVGEIDGSIPFSDEWIGQAISRAWIRHRFLENIYKEIPRFTPSVRID